MKHTPFVLLLAALGGCASSKPQAPAMPSAEASRIAINRPTPRTQPAAAPAAVPAPIPIPTLAPVAQPPAVRPAPVWRIQKSDGTVANLLARWAKDAGWKVHWEGAPDIAITGDSEVGKPDFVSAADFVVSDLKAKGHPIKAKAFADNVLVIKRAEP